MLNTEIAKIFYDVADIFEMLGVAWKPIAYRKAARQLESLSKDVKDIYEDGGLESIQEIPSIGEGLAKKIVQYIETGKILEFEKLKAKLPKGLAKLLEIESIGPKRAAILYRKLKIKSVEDLKNAIEKNKIVKLAGFGQKSQQNITAGLDIFQKGKERFSLGEVIPIANEIISIIKKVPGVEQAIPAGSVRRWKETVGDLDILVISKHAERVMDIFTKMPSVKRVLAKGKTKSTVILKDGLQADIRVLEKKSFGAALNYFTGNVDHNVALRRIAIEKGYKLSEYGLFNRKTNKFTAGRTEEELYKKLGLSYIEPEMRENRGEIAAAMAGKLPKLIKLNDIRGDLHTHTQQSDGTNTIEQMAQAAQNLGYEYVCVSDHSKTTAIAHGLDIEQVNKQILEIKKLQNKFKIKILTGSEVDILGSGELDFPDDVLKKLDIVIGSVHSGFKSPGEKMTVRIAAALQNKYLTILGHPTGRLVNKRNPYEVDLKKIFDVAAQNKKIVEISAHPSRLDLKDEHILLARQYGLKFAINSDAHSTEQLKLMQFGAHNARRGWLEANDVINTYKFSELKKFLH
ncbi:MAG: DNA polymerase/3'-5' exonuclease PolX [DPANN group archaeon]|nr:DNA polymerase/3'-5' exonuclease PolX [DPANN group archaeon]